MRHPFLESVAESLAMREVATLRYEFPYMRQGKRRPDPARTLQASVREAIDRARERESAMPIIAGGKSMGGRMTSLAAAGGELAGVAGLAFLGFPLHAPGRPATSRADHLDEVRLPMLFVQGTRDKLADIDLVRSVCERLAGRATLHIVEGGDHSFNVLKRSGRRPEEVMDEIGRAVSDWVNRILGRR